MPCEVCVNEKITDPELSNCFSAVVGRLFHQLPERTESLPFADFFFGNLKSVSVSHRLWLVGGNGKY